jgi:hypothetical protein
LQLHVEDGETQGRECFRRALLSLQRNFLSATSVLEAEQQPLLSPICPSLLLIPLCHFALTDVRDSSHRATEFQKTLLRYLELLAIFDFVHRPVFQKIREHNVSETGSVSVLR